MRPPSHPYAPLLHRVQKPAQYLGGEPGEKPKDWSAVDCRICLAFPDLYEIGMSHLGYKILYGLINDHPRLLAERAYAVWGDMEAQLREHGEPLRSLETWRPLGAFDIVGFSLQYELTYTNILCMLELGGVPRFSHARGDDDPLVVAGGPVATHAEPIAPFIDAFLIGDGEARVPELMLAWADMKRRGVPRADRLAAIARMEGFYVPSLYTTREDPETGFHVVDAAVGDAPLPVRRTFIRDLNDYPFPTDGPIAATETIFDRVSVEIARGCTEGCRFCQAGMIYRPVRERQPRAIIDAVTRSVDAGGYDEASLTCLSTADYSAIAPLVHETMKSLADRQVSLSVSSLRAYGLAPEVLDEMKTQRLGGLTFAPEAGTQRMRDVVNKNVTEAQLMETAERVFSRGWTKMKLYFMIGLPTEEDDDVRGIVQTGARALATARRARGRKGARVTVSVSTHVPKPHTPFQWCAMDPYEEILRKQRLLRDEARGTGIQLRMHESKGSWLEGVLARGDRRLAAVISDAYDAGARFDSWEERIDLEAWHAAFAAHGIEPRAFLGTLPVTARLPWDHIDVGLEPGFLAREYRKALKNRLSPPCGKPAGTFVHPTNLEDARAETRRLVCYDCGIACDLGEMREERIAALASLGAEKPLPPAPVDKKTDATDLEASPDSHPQPPVRPDQGPPVRVRLAFTKLGRMAYSAHLDLVRIFPRLFRRLDLPLYHSQGFHPKPQMAFSPALSLGVASLCEYVDLKLRANAILPDELEKLAERLSAVTVPGVEFRALRVLAPEDRSLNSVLTEAEYVAGVPSKVLADLGIGGADELAARVAERVAQGGLTAMRPLEKGLSKKIDVSKPLRSVVVGSGAAELADAGIVGELIPVRIVLGLDADGTAKASEVVEALLGAEQVPARIVRAGLYARVDGRRVTPLDLEALRAAAPVVVPSREDGATLSA